MSQRDLTVTFRDGKPVGAYLHLRARRDGTGVARTADVGRGMLVDYDAAGRALGVEITGPLVVTADDVSDVLEALGEARLAPGEWNVGRAA
jgi:hypothetical protein